MARPAVTPKSPRAFLMHPETLRILVPRGKSGEPPYTASVGKTREYSVPGGRLEVDEPSAPCESWTAVYESYPSNVERSVIASTALYPHMPRGDHAAVRDWFVDRFLADQPPAVVRVEAARQEAVELGFDLVIDHSANMLPDLSYMAHVVPRDETVGRFVAYAPTELDAALAAVHILHGIVERGDRWPEP